MKIVVFGLTITSSWGNGHATLWRGLARALAEQGHHLVFFERNLSYYADTRDLFALEGGDLVLYDGWDDVRLRADREIADADVAMVTSFCPDAIAASDAVLDGKAGLRVFYDLDTPVTLAQFDRAGAVAYIGPRGLRDFDLVLSFTGGRALDEVHRRFNAPRVVPLYGHVDPAVYRACDPVSHYRNDLSYIGTYSEDRQERLERLFVVPARERPERRFVIAGAQYPHDFPWSPNIYFVRHLPPGEHSAFFSSSRLTLNVTRKPMAEMGWCPSGRLFEAAACGTPILSDIWSGLEDFFTPGSEILIAQDSTDAIAVLDMDEAELRRIGQAARERVYAEHTSQHRASEMIAAFAAARTFAAPVPARMEA